MKSGIQYLLLFLAIGLVSCVAEADPTIESGTSVTFEVQTDVEGETKATEPGEEALNENKIQTVDVLFYNGETQVFYPDNTLTSFDAGTNKVTIHIPSSARPLFNNITSYTMVVLANLNLTPRVLDGMTYTQMRQTISNADFTGSSHPQTNFLMDGTVSTVLSFNNAVLPTVSLGRAAVKIRTSILQAQVPGYTPVSAKVKLMNYLDKTSLTSGLPYSSSVADFKSTIYRDLSVPGVTTTTTNPFYTFESDWTLARPKEPYLIVEMVWKNNTTQAQEPYYYKVPFNYLNSPDIASGLAFKLNRNTIYDIGLKIDKLGSKKPDEPKSIQSNCIIKDWTNKTVLARFEKFDYLVVHELYVNMYNISQRSIGYTSSLPIEIVDVKASCIGYDIDGIPVDINYVSGNPEFPTFTISATSINITSTIPINYVPKKITFTVRTVGGLLSQYVTVYQFPPIYVTAQASTGSSNPGHDNLNLFKITTIVPFDDIYKIGDPRRYNESVMTTRVDAEGNNIRSPQFVIASQLGVSANSLKYADAQQRCINYQESVFLSPSGTYTYPQGKWRIPTKAEIMLIDKIQDDPNSAIKKLMISSSFWSAFMYEYYNFSTNVFQTGSANSGGAKVQCITDTWDLP